MHKLFQQEYEEFILKNKFRRITTNFKKNISLLLFLSVKLMITIFFHFFIKKFNTLHLFSLKKINS
jgi:uncharacterized membrane protein